MDNVRHVLLVDDDDDIRTIGTISLQQLGGFEVTAASSGHDGVELARSGQPDVILLDMMMPELDGKGTLAMLQADAATSHIPVIFMTAKVQDRDIDDYIEAGATGVIAKPFDPVSLPDEVQAIVAQRARAGG